MIQKFEGKIGDPDGAFLKLQQEGKVVTNINDLDSIDWGAEIAKTPKEVPKSKKWEVTDIKDIFGFPLSIGDKILRATEPKYPDTEVFVKSVIKKIDLTKDYPLGVLSEGKERIGWIRHNRVLSQPSLTKIL